MTSSGKVDGVFRMRSLGTATAGITDQYSDGKAAKVWQLYIGRYCTRLLDNMLHIQNIQVTSHQELCITNNS